MPNTATRYARAALTTTSATLYTVPAGATALVTEIILSNTTAIDITATITLSGVALFTAAPVPANGILTLGLKQVVSTTEIIAGFASAAGLNVFISGVNVT